jgi:ectoine hydroxylase-related dioxygenase (phytanoyl-CoA dioxygenase family)
VQADRQKQEQIVSLAVYLENSDEDNGCFQLIPASHVNGYLPPPPSVAHNSATLKPHTDLSIPSGGEALGPVLNVPCTAGTAIVFSANMLHSALPNRSASRSRYSLFWHYLPRHFLPLQFGLDYVDRHQL